jgi:ankyrin repeat protein
LDNGADIKSVFRKLLNQAVSSKQLDKIKLLIGLGANINEPDENGNTLLMTAVMQNSVDIIRFLYVLNNVW